MLNLDKLKALLDGSATPKNEEEKLFVLGYKSALNAEGMEDPVLQLTGYLDSASADELRHFIFGYVVGQRTLKDIEEDADLQLNNGSKTFH